MFSASNTLANIFHLYDIQIKPHIVEVNGQNTRTIYLKEPFKGLEKPSFMEVSRNYNILDLIRNAEIVYQE